MKEKIEARSMRHEPFDSLCSLRAKKRHEKDRNTRDEGLKGTKHEARGTRKKRVLGKDTKGERSLQKNVLKFSIN